MGRIQGTPKMYSGGIVIFFQSFLWSVASLIGMEEARSLTLTVEL